MKKQSRERRTHTTISDILNEVKRGNDKTVIAFQDTVNQKVKLGGVEV